MVNLRVFGLVVSLIALWLFVRSYKRHRNKIPFLLGLSFVVVLASVSLFPDFFNVLFNLLTESRDQYYRINLLLVLGVLGLAILQIKTLFTTSFHEQTLSEVIRRHGLREFDRKYGPDRIKPIQVLIPAYNEARNLEKLLPEIPRAIDDREVGILVISDGSRDSTAATAEQAGAAVIENLANIGGGTSLAIGFDVARRHGAQVVVTMDGDGQHNPEDLPRLVGPILDGEADLVVGSRRKHGTLELSLLRRIGVYVFNGMISLLLGQTITDCSNGYRAFRSEITGRFELRERQYHTTEFLIRATAEGVRLREIPVEVQPREHGESKKGPDLVYGWNFFKVILETWLRR